MKHISLIALCLMISGCYKQHFHNTELGEVEARYNQRHFLGAGFYEAGYPISPEQLCEDTQWQSTSLYFNWLNFGISAAAFPLYGNWSLNIECPVRAEDTES